MNLKRVFWAVLLSAACAAYSETITCGGDGPRHLQGVTCDGSAIYWSYTTRLVKTDLTGAQLAAVDVPGHSGDLCVHLGKVYIATEEGRYVRESNFKQEVRVYDAATLNLLKKYNIDADCAAKGLLSSSIEYANGRFWLAMGQESGSTDTKNYVLEYTPSFDSSPRMNCKRAIRSTAFRPLPIMTASFTLAPTPARTFRPAPSSAIVISKVSCPARLPPQKA